MKPILVVGMETVIPPILRLADKYAVFPLWQEAWAGYQDRIEIVRPKVNPNGLLGTLLRDTSRILAKDDFGEIDAEDLAAFYFQSAQPLYVLIEVLDALRKEFSIGGVVVHNDVEPITRLACQWGNLRGILTIHIPHAHYFDIWRDEIGWDVHDVVTAKTVLAINKVQASWYQARGARKVIVTGNPIWDRWARFTVTKERARTLLGLRKGPAVCYLSSWPQSTSLLGAHGLDRVTFPELCGAIKTLGWQLVLLHHFRANDEINRWHVETAKNLGVEGISTKDNFGLCLQAADVVTAFGPSNALIEASILGKPVLALGGSAPPVPGAPPDSVAIQTALLQMHDAGPQPGVQMLAPNVGEATQKAAEALLEVLNDGSTD